MRVVHTHSEEETMAVGQEAAASLAAGDLVRLEGPLGAGKTAFVRGLAVGLGCDPGDVSSPTFALIQEYPGRDVTLMHVDLYRLTPAEAEDLALDDQREDAVMAVEWPDRWHRAPRAALDVRIERVDERTRRITLEGPA